MPAIDILRLDDQGNIVEHRDLLQRIPSGVANNHSMC